jgi:hypothetical protein
LAKKTNSCGMKNKMGLNSSSIAPTHIATEKELQRRIRQALRDPLTEWRTTSGAMLSVVSVGEWNHHEGPDFLNMALQVEGSLLIGHGEVHWRSSDWEQHHHDANPMYSGILLHIVLHDNRTSTPFARYTLVMPEETVLRGNVLNAASTLSAANTTNNIPQSDLHDVLRDYATQRFLRKARYASAVLTLYDTTAVFMSLLNDFLQRRLGKKHLPNGLKKIAHALERSDCQEFVPFLQFIEASPAIDNVTQCTNAAQNVVKQCAQTGLCGLGTASEILVNIVLPLAYAYCVKQEGAEAAQHEAAQYLVRSFLHIPAVNQYAHLKRKFPQIPQHYVWQQQGLLEYEAEVGTHTKQTERSIQAVAAHQTAEMVMTFYAI